MKTRIAKLLDQYRLTGYLPPIAGGAQGYNEKADYITTTVDGYELNGMWDEFQRTLNILNAQRDPLIDRMTFPVETPVERVLQLTGDDFEEADEYGKPKSIRLGVPYNLGFELKFFDLGIGYTYRFLTYAKGQQLEALNNSALQADRRLLMKTIMTRVFDNTDTATTLLELQTSVPVYPFYNADGIVPPGWKSYVHTSGHTHYLTSGNAAVTSPNIDTIIDHIHHHGYDNGATLILLVNRTESVRIQTFTIAGGARYDFIPKAGISWRGTLVGSQPGDPSGLDVYPGFVGVYGPIAVIEEDYLPPGYLFAFASGGLRADRNPIGIRQHENASARGLKLFPGDRNDYPLVNSYYHHALGAGVRHRGAGVVMQVTAGSYAIPTLVFAGPGGR